MSTRSLWERVDEPILRWVASLSPIVPLVLWKFETRDPPPFEGLEDLTDRDAHAGRRSRSPSAHRAAKAFAWGADSQRFPNWDNPQRKLDQPGRYDVTIRLDASGVNKAERFSLELGDPGGRIEWAESGTNAQIDSNRRKWTRIPRAIARRVAEWDAAWVREK